ncbi:MAG TPA: CDP-alcohol phosphatidyltransferase family protein [Bryobacteraceae bacterium]|nr:CDP-alcohol phosphatidyltransferase family protein [Bryobacteraceae bacterium]
MTRYLPNLLTAARLALVPFVAVEVLGGHSGTALVLTFAAGATDGLDGFLARRFGWSSRLGAWLDPLADKALLVTLFFTLGWVGAFPWWLVFLVFARDAVILLMVGAAFAFTEIRDFPPSVWGKISTLIQVGACLGILLLLCSPSRWALQVSVFLVLATAVGTVWSGVDYVRIGLLRWRKERAAQMR